MERGKRLRIYRLRLYEFKRVFVKKETKWKLKKLY